MIAVGAVAMLTAAMLQVSSTVARSSIGRVDRQLAFYAAEAGLAEAFSGLQTGRSGNVGTAALPAAFGHGLFWVEAEELDDGLVRLESTGMVAGGTARLSLVARRGRPSVATLGAFSGGALALGPGSEVDGYDSRLGPLAEQAPQLGRLGANGAIELAGTHEAPTVLYADVTPGPGESVALDGAVTLDGATSSAPAERELPPVEVPELAAVRGVRVEQPGVPLVVPGGEGALPILEVGPGSSVVLEGPATWTVGRLALAAGAELLVDTRGGPVELYVTEALALEVGSRLSTTGEDATRATVQVAGEPAEAVRILAEGRFAGVVYAPEAEVELGGALELLGAVVARALRVGDGARLCFDHALTAAAAEGTLPRLRSWRILELSQPGRGPRTGNPFARLGVDPALCPAPGDAHAEQHLDVVYLDGGGALQTYSGPESGFDWGLVGDLLSAARDGIDFVLPGPRPGGPSPLDLLLDQLAAGGLTSAQMRDQLLAASPLTPEHLDLVLDLHPELTAAHLEEILDAHYPLPERLLQTVVESAPLDSAALRRLLAAHPLPTTSVQLAAVGRGALGGGDLVDLLVSWSPLSLDVLTAATTRVPSLLLWDLTRLLGAQ